MRAALLLFAVCAVATGAEEERPRPEAKWLQTDLLHKWVKEMTHTSEIKDDRVIITLKGATKNMIIAEFSDNDSLKLTASWDSSQEDLGDGPIVNSWNNERRFCKVSISDKPNDEPGTLMVMHFDQLLPSGAGVDAVRKITKQSVELFETGVLEFDQFSKDTYREWLKNADKE